jgi:hypothetical protein
MIVCTELQIQKNCGEMQSTAAVDRPWENLLLELLGRVAAMCPNPTDRARFRCVRRSWRLAVRHHYSHAPSSCSPTANATYRRLSCTIQPSDGGPYRLVSLPEGTTCVGSIDGWRRHVPAA